MHTVCLGVVKRLTLSYLTTTLGYLDCYFRAQQLHERVIKHRHSLPFEFKRKIRSFKEINYFKGTEYRTIILYTGPFFFQNILPHYYKHFLLLHFSIYSFCLKNSVFVPNGKACIEKFHSKIHDLFGVEAYTFNNHLLTHLGEFLINLDHLIYSICSRAFLVY